MPDLTKEEILNLFTKTEALFEGHFELSSGLHSPKYLQCAKVLQYPEHARKLCEALAQKVKDQKIDVVIGAATGGVIISFLVAQYLGVRSLFAERKEGELLLRRGFEIKKGERVLIVEDVITTGGTVVELKKMAEEKGAVPVSVSTLINRSADTEKIDELEIVSLLRLAVPAYEKQTCPLCQNNIPVTKPGSKKLNN